MHEWSQLLCHLSLSCHQKNDRQKDVFLNECLMLLCSFSFIINESWTAQKMCIDTTLWQLKDDQISDVNQFSSCIYVSWIEFSRCQTLNLIVVSWLWVSLVIVSDSSSSFSLAFVMMFSKASVAMWWVKHLLSFQYEWCRLKSSMISCSQSFLISLFRQEIVDDSSVKIIDSEHEL